MTLDFSSWLDIWWKTSSEGWRDVVTPPCSQHQMLCGYNNHAHNTRHGMVTTTMPVTQDVVWFQQPCPKHQTWCGYTNNASNIRRGVVKNNHARNTRCGVVKTTMPTTPDMVWSQLPCLQHQMWCGYNNHSATANVMGGNKKVEGRWKRTKLQKGNQKKSIKMEKYERKWTK